MANERERYIAMSTKKPAKVERYLKFTTADFQKPPATTQAESRYPQSSPPKLSIPSKDGTVSSLRDSLIEASKVIVMKKKRAQTLSPEHYKTSTTPKEKRSNMPALKTRTAAPAYITHNTESPTVVARTAYSVFEGAAGSNLLTTQVDRVRLEHERAINEERGQNCCLCGLLVVSIFVAAALLTVAFYDRATSRRSANLTESGDINSDIYFKDIEFVTGRKINKEFYTKAPVNYTRTLKNLTESCASKIEPQGCFYHKNIYPDNCVTTRCNSVIVNILTNNYDTLFDWHYTNELVTIDVEDWTPCAPGNLCIGGQCVKHKDASRFVFPEAHPGGVRLICNSSRTCVRIDGTLIGRESAERYMSCEKKSCQFPTFSSHIFVNEIAIRFLSCNNPYPVEMDPGCFPRLTRLISEYVPFVMYELCHKCQSVFSDSACFSTSRYGGAIVFGVPCRSGSLDKINNTFCAGSAACVPLYKDYPETYSIRPIQKC